MGRGYKVYATLYFKWGRAYGVFIWKRRSRRQDYARITQRVLNSTPALRHLVSKLRHPTGYSDSALRFGQRFFGRSSAYPPKGRQATLPGLNTLHIPAFLLPHPADAGSDGDACEQHRADRHAGDDASHGAVSSEHIIVKSAENVTDAHQGSDDGCAGERDGALLQVADAPNLRELRIDLWLTYMVMYACACA